VPEPALDRSAIETARSVFRARLDAADSDQKLKALHDEFLSRKSGSVTGLMKTLGTLAPDARREIGQLVNTLKDRDRDGARRKSAQLLESTRQPAGAVDVTLRGRQLPMGRIHPLMRVRREVEDIFTHMGYEILEGPEVEDDFHNFEALNMPPDHPHATCRTRSTSPRRSPGARGALIEGTCRRRRSAPRHCCARTPPRCRFAT
jgi:phenylalanyl-tRNA synthetase alpha chain